MNTLVIAALAAGIGLAVAGAAHAQSQADALPEALKPRKIAGPGINVIDLEAQKAWYETMLGFKTVQQYDRDGAVFEYILTVGERGGPILALLKAGARPEGRNGFSRLILDVPDAKALAARLTAQGVTAREVVPDVAFFISDPEGNPIELYTAPKPKP
jgi:catechol 2,3-dioxygenase-like lactoylglutathione lyase family enzyme